MLLYAVEVAVASVAASVDAAVAVGSLLVQVPDLLLLMLQSAAWDWFQFSVITGC